MLLCSESIDSGIYKIEVIVDVVGNLSLNLRRSGVEDASRCMISDESRGTSRLHTRRTQNHNRDVEVKMTSGLHLPFPRTPDGKKEIEGASRKVRERRSRGGWI